MVTGESVHSSTSPGLFFFIASYLTRLSKRISSFYNSLKFKDALSTVLPAVKMDEFWLQNRDPPVQLYGVLKTGYPKRHFGAVAPKL